MKISNYFTSDAEKSNIFFNDTTKISSNLKSQKTGQKNNKSKVMSLNEGIDEMIKILQERIGVVKQNEKYDDETKKSKIEQLQTQIDELNELKTMKELEAVTAKMDESKKKSMEKEEEPYTDKNEDGDIYLSEEDAKFLVDGQTSLDKISYYSTIKAKMASEAYRLKSETAIDGYTPRFKGTLIGKLTRGMARLEMTRSLTIGNVRDSIDEAVRSKVDEVDKRSVPDKNLDKVNRKDEAEDIEETKETVQVD